MKFRQVAITVFVTPGTTNDPPNRSTRNRPRNNDHDDKKQLERFRDAKKKQKRTGTLVLESRVSYTPRLHGEVKLQLLCEMVGEMLYKGGTPNYYVERDRVFLIQFAVPIVKCFKKCCRGSTVKFFKIYGVNFKHTMFKNSTCKHHPKTIRSEH